MKQIVGVIGAAGDLGSQLVRKLEALNDTVLVNDIRIDGSTPIPTLMEQCDVVHVCAPLDQLETVSWPTSSGLIILHDSTMNTSRTFNSKFLGGGAAIVHLLMNDHSTAVVATDGARADAAGMHIARLGHKVTFMLVDEHDRLMAKSQAPLALLCQTLLPHLNEQCAAGMLTTSGEDLVDALRKRKAAWTPETIQSILRNPQLPCLIEDMQLIIAQIGYNKR